MTGADGNGQRITTRLVDEVGSLIRIGQQLIHGQGPASANAIFFAGFTCLKGP